jgi:hypothetical protein
MVCLHEGRPVAGALFVCCEGIVQYHLGGTRDDALALAPMALILDEARRWASEQGCQALHLGGGASGRPDDSLFHFKSGFSDRTHPFCVWRWIVLPEVYDELCSRKRAWEQRRAVRAAPGFFPAYRSPVVPCVPALATPCPEEVA